jgi:type IV secretory pathway protease TraF
MKMKFFAAVLFFYILFLGTAYSSGVRINFTSSLPQWLWLVYPIKENDEIRRGEYVVVPRSEIGAARFDRRTRDRYFGGNIPFLKEVFALPGETVEDGGMTVSSDSEGYPLPKIPLPLRLGRDEYWLSSDRERGFDSRYFGPVKRRAISGKAVPLL